MNVRNSSERATKRARDLRKEMGESELKLWTQLRRKPMGLRFRRQHPIGTYILDFYCHAARLCVEVDGDFHVGREARDQERDDFLASLGIETMRIDSWEVIRNTKGVTEHVLRGCCTKCGIDYDTYGVPEGALKFNKPSP